MIAILTIGFQAIKAEIDLADSRRSEEYDISITLRFILYYQ